MQEIAKPDTDAMVVANEIALALQAKGAGFKMVIKRAMQATMDAGALGIKNSSFWSFGWCRNCS